MFVLINAEIPFQFVVIFKFRRCFQNNEMNELKWKNM